MGEMSAQQLAEVLGALAAKRTEAPMGVLSGAQVAVQPGPNNSRFARLVVVMPDGLTYAVQVEEV